RQRARRDDLHVALGRRFAETHDGAPAELLFDLKQRRFQRLLLVRGRQRKIPLFKSTAPGPRGPRKRRPPRWSGRSVWTWGTAETFDVGPGVPLSPKPARAPPGPGGPSAEIHLAQGAAADQVQRRHRGVLAHPVAVARELKPPGERPLPGGAADKHQA